MFFRLGLGLTKSLRKWLLTRGLAVAAIVCIGTGILAQLTGRLADSVAVLTGTLTPSEVGYQWLSVPLMIVGYLIVPAVVGGVVAVVIQRQLRAMLLDPRQAERLIDAVIDAEDTNTRK